MSEVLVKFDEPIMNQRGEMYFAEAVGQQREDDRLWEGWLEFEPVNGSTATISSERETTQPNRTDRRDGLAVENRKPYPATVDCFPDAAVDRAEIEIVGTTGNAARGGDAPTAEWPDHPPAQAGKKLGRKWTGCVVIELPRNW